jgi:hypothetical protein
VDTHTVTQHILNFKMMERLFLFDVFLHFHYPYLVIVTHYVAITKYTITLHSTTLCPRHGVNEDCGGTQIWLPTMQHFKQPATDQSLFPLLGRRDNEKVEEVAC